MILIPVGEERNDYYTTGTPHYIDVNGQYYRVSNVINGTLAAPQGVVGATNAVWVSTASTPTVEQYLNRMNLTSTTTAGGTVAYYPYSTGTISASNITNSYVSAMDLNESINRSINRIVSRCMDAVNSAEAEDVGKIEKEMSDDTTEIDKFLDEFTIKED